MSQERPPRHYLLLGYAGLLPPLLGCAVQLALPGTIAAHVAKHGTLLYAALIFSFLGGTWWGLLAAKERSAPLSDLLISVAPSLLAMAALILPNRSAGGVGLAVLILLSPLIDRHFVQAGVAPPWWLKLRLPLSIGLAALTAIAALVR